MIDLPFLSDVRCWRRTYDSRKRMWATWNARVAGFRLYLFNIAVLTAQLYWEQKNWETAFKSFKSKVSFPERETGFGYETVRENLAVWSYLLPLSPRKQSLALMGTRQLTAFLAIAASGTSCPKYLSVPNPCQVRSMESRQCSVKLPIIDVAPSLTLAELDSFNSGPQ